jgi:hypothetical protein
MNISLVLGLFLAGQDLEAPKLVLDGDQPINVEIGHAAPYFYDVDGDGKKDLVVGQFGGGKVRVYLNKGTSAEPRFEGWTFLKAGGGDATVPYG